MKDGIIKGTGDSRYLKSSIPEGTTWEQTLALLISGKFPIDLNGINKDGWIQIASALNAADLLPNDVAAALGLDPADNPQVKDALYLCGDKIGDIKITKRKDLGDSWVLCNGEMININSYPQLYNLTEKTDKSKKLPNYTDMENDYNSAYLYCVNGYFIMCLYGDWNGHEHSKVFSCPATQEAISKNLWTSVGINLPVATSLDGVKYYNGKYYFLAYSYTSATNPSSLSSIYYSTTLSGPFTRVTLPRQYTSRSCYAQDFDIDNNGNIAITAYDNDRGNRYYRIIHGNVSNLTTETLVSIQVNNDKPITEKSIVYHGGFWYYFSKYRTYYPDSYAVKVFRSSTIANILTSEKQTLYFSSDYDIPVYGAYVDDNYVVVMYKHKDETGTRVQYTTPQDFLFTAEKTTMLSSDVNAAPKELMIVYDGDYYLAMGNGLFRVGNISDASTYALVSSGSVEGYGVGEGLILLLFHAYATKISTVKEYSPHLPLITEDNTYVYIRGK